MWLQKYDKKFVNMNNVSMIGVYPVPDKSESFQVKAWLAGEDDVNVTLYVGTHAECELYRIKLGEALGAQKIEVMEEGNVTETINRLMG